jgi:hypothetical protein
MPESLRWSSAEAERMCREGISMTQKIVNLSRALGELPNASDKKLRCAICGRVFSARESNGCAYWSSHGSADLAVIHAEHRCENCLIQMAWDIDRQGRFTECGCATPVPKQSQPFCPLFG